MAPPDISAYDTDPTLYLFTSLAAGSSLTFSQTARIETILKANRVAFTYADTGSDERAKALWARRSRGKRLPALVQRGEIVAVSLPVARWCGVPTTAGLTHPFL